MLAGATALFYLVGLPLDFVAERASGWYAGSVSEFVIVQPGILVTFVVGWLLVLRRAGGVIGWLLLANWLVLLTAALASTYAGYAYGTGHDLPGARAGAIWDTHGWPLLFAAFLAIALVVPDGHLLSPRWRPVAWVAAVVLRPHPDRRPHVEPGARPSLGPRPALGPAAGLRDRAPLAGRPARHGRDPAAGRRVGRDPLPARRPDRAPSAQVDRPGRPAAPDHHHLGFLRPLGRLVRAADVRAAPAAAGRRAAQHRRRRAALPALRRRPRRHHHGRLRDADRAPRRRLRRGDPRRRRRCSAAAARSRRPPRRSPWLSPSAPSGRRCSVGSSGPSTPGDGRASGWSTTSSSISGPVVASPRPWGRRWRRRSATRACRSSTGSPDKGCTRTSSAPCCPTCQRRRPDARPYAVATCRSAPSCTPTVPPSATSSSTCSSARGWPSRSPGSASRCAGSSRRSSGRGRGSSAPRWTSDAGSSATSTTAPSSSSSPSAWTCGTCRPGSTPARRSETSSTSRWAGWVTRSAVCASSPTASVPPPSTPVSRRPWRSWPAAPRSARCST